MENIFHHLNNRNPYRMYHNQERKKSGKKKEWGEYDTNSTTATPDRMYHACLCCKIHELHTHHPSPTQSHTTVGFCPTLMLALRTLGSFFEWFD